LLVGLVVSAYQGCPAARVSVQGVKSLGGRFACLCQEFYEKKENKYYYFLKRKGIYFYTFNHFYSEKSSKKIKIAQIYSYDPQSARIKGWEEILLFSVLLSLFFLG
jgi:hypothetical protein